MSDMGTRIVRTASISLMWRGHRSAGAAAKIEALFELQNRTARPRLRRRSSQSRVPNGTLVDQDWNRWRGAKPRWTNQPVACRLWKKALLEAWRLHNVNYKNGLCAAKTVAAGDG
jgi:hypothetical protein